MVQWLTKQQVLRLLESRHMENIWLQDDETITFGTGKDVAVSWDGTNLIFNPVVGTTMAVTFAVGGTYIHGGAATGDDLYLKANSTDTRPYILLQGNSMIRYAMPLGANFDIQEVTNTFMVFNRTGSTYTTDATTTTARDFDVRTVTTGTGVLFRASGLTTGKAVHIYGDSDDLTTGSLLEVTGGAGADKSWLKVIKNSSDTEGCQVIIDGDNVIGAPAKPSLRIGSAESGFYMSAVNVMNFAIGGVARLHLADGSLASETTNSWQMTHTASTSTTPCYNFVGDQDTGIGWAAADALSAISGAIEGTRWTEVSDHIIQANEAQVGITANTGSAQGDGVLLSTNNVISVCANAGDAVTLPATFIVGTEIRIKNDGALSADVFPALDDDLGAGANTAAALASGASITYIATAANATWTSIAN